MPQRAPFLTVLRALSRFAGLTCLILGATTYMPAQTESVLHSFNVAPFGDSPQWRPVADAFGNLYGTASSGGTYGGGTAFRLSPKASGGYAFSVVYNFGVSDNSGNQPGPLVIDSSGNLYGTVSLSKGDAVFRLTSGPNGTWKSENISTFPYNGGPWGVLTFDHAGNLYGVSAGGGANKAGAVYELSPTKQGPWLLTTLYSFTGAGDGGTPNGGLAFDASGNLYGTTGSGGDPACNPFQPNSTCGVVFKLTNNGNGTWSNSTLLVFDYTNGAFPAGGPVFDSKGNLYGAVTGNTGGCGCGAIFRLSPNPDGTWTESLIYTFASGPDAAYPNGDLILDRHGNIYGTSIYGGSSVCGYYGCGTIFELSPTSGAYWKDKILHHFGPGVAGAFPFDGVTLDSAGNLYGVTTSSGANPGCSSAPYYACQGTIFKLTSKAGGQWSMSLLHAYSPGNDGLYPSTSLVSDNQGNLFGLAVEGGDYNCGQFGCGTVFEVSPQTAGGWSESTIYSFTNAFGGLSAEPIPAPNLITDAAGNLYGSAPTGYIGPPCACGFVFELSPTSTGAWQETVLHAFTGGSDQALPNAVTFGPNGKLYGAGAGGYSGGQYGTVFELTPNSNGAWSESTLFSFNNSNGAYPRSGVAIDPAGNIYGTTLAGGLTSKTCTYGCGVIFELSPTGTRGWTEKTLYAFKGGEDGFAPTGLVLDAFGNLYGETSFGGAQSPVCGGYYRESGCGLVFRLSNNGAQWSKTVLYTFAPDAVPGDGAFPIGGMTLDAAGKLYGTTSGGGDLTCALYQYAIPGCGTVFKLSPQAGGSWTETILHAFELDDGASPIAAPLLDSSGNLFGTALYGGNDDAGVVYEIPAGSGAATNRIETHPLASRKGALRRMPMFSPMQRGPASLRGVPYGVSAGKEIR